MREKYETLSLAVLRELAKARELKGVTGLKKADLIDRMVAEDEKLREQNEQSEAEKESAKPVEEEVQKEEPVKQDKPLNTERTDRQSRIEKTDKTERTEGQTQNQQREMRPRRAEGENRDDINSELDSGVTADGILEVMPDGYGFIRCENYLPGEHDVYVSPSQIRRFGLKTGDIIRGNTRIKTQGEKFSALLYITTINGYHPSVVAQRRNFEDLTPIFPWQGCARYRCTLCQGL